MKGKVTLGGVIAFLKIYLTFVCCWPLPANATKLQRLRRTAFRCLCFTNSMAYSIAAAWTLYKHTDDMFLVMKLGCQFSVIVQIPLQLALFAMQDERLQLIVLEMENYYKSAQRYEREIFQQYVDRCKSLYGGILFCLMMTAINMVMRPLFLPQPFPGDLEYPFGVQHQPMRTIIYVHQALTCYQSMLQVSANAFAALLLWFTAARFDILSIRFRIATNIKELINCVREHRVLLRYAEEVKLAVRYVAFLCVTCSTSAVIFGCLTFLSRQPWSGKWLFLMIAVCAFVELYMYAWPADNVKSTSSDIAFAIYDSLWYNNDAIAQKILMHVITRSQRPVTISIPCILPNLSMNYYASYISTIYTFMTLVRVMTGDE